MNVLGCNGTSGDRPTEKEGEAAIPEVLKRYDDAGAIKILSFRKTNGQAQEIAGIKMYKMEYRCLIEFTRNCQHNRGSMSTSNGTPNVKIGTREEVTGAITFEKTENGWRYMQGG
jgi:hypothetical protein